MKNTYAIGITWTALSNYVLIREVANLKTMLDSFSTESIKTVLSRCNGSFHMKNNKSSIVKFVLVGSRDPGISAQDLAISQSSGQVKYGIIQYLEAAVDDEFFYEELTGWIPCDGSDGSNLTAHGGWSYTVPKGLSKIFASSDELEDHEINLFVLAIVVNGEASSVGTMTVITEADYNEVKMTPRLFME